MLFVYLYDRNKVLYFVTGDSNDWPAKKVSDILFLGFNDFFA